MAVAKDAPTKPYTVARGRSIVHDGKPYEAGAELTLAIDEGERLQKLGFFLDDDGDMVAIPDGPPTVAGATIREI